MCCFAIEPLQGHDQQHVNRVPLIDNGIHLRMRYSKTPEKGEPNHMCDEHYENDLEQRRLRLGLSRREFATMTAAAGLSMLLPHAAAAAVEVKEEEVNIKTPDGTADAYFVHPATGTGAGVIVWP